MRVGGQSNQGGRAYGTRLMVASLLVGSFFLVLVGRLYVLQISRGEEFAGKSQENFIKELRKPASRGMILDRHGVALVDERPSYDVFLTPAFCRNCEETIARLAQNLELDGEAVQKVRDQVKKAKGLVRFRAFPVKIDVPRDDLDKLNANLIDLQGIDVIPTPHRHYRYGVLGSHVLGYMNEISSDELAALPSDAPKYEQGDYIGRRGIERRYERELKGKDGIERVVVDARGNRIDAKADLIKEEQRTVPALPGHNLVLTLDVRLQEAAEKAFPGRAGAVIALDVNTGDVLALVSRPGYDPNMMSGRITREQLRALSDDPLQPMIFRPTQQQYNPGSTFKTVTAITALESGVIHPAGGIFCNGGYSLGKRRWRCDKETGHGMVDLTHALGASCDVYFYALGDRMDIEPIANMSKALGLGSPTGLDLGYETPGVVPSKEWHDKYTPGGYHHGFALNTAIGQGDNNVTPMQLAVLYAAIANGGTVYKPHLLKRVEDASGHLLREIQPEVERKLPIKPETIAAVKEGLKAVVNQPGGTAYYARLKDFPIMVAGKTGTAQVGAIGAVRIKEQNLDYWHKSHSWFASFAPADNPEIAVVVLNEHGGFGASGAAPTAMQVFKAYFELKSQDLLASQQGQGVNPPAPGALPGKAPSEVSPLPAKRPAGPPEPNSAPALAARQEGLAAPAQDGTPTHPLVAPRPEAAPRPKPVEAPQVSVKPQEAPQPEPTPAPPAPPPSEPASGTGQAEPKPAEAAPAESKPTDSAPVLPEEKAPERKPEPSELPPEEPGAAPPSPGTEKQP